MTDEQLIEALRRLDVPAAPEPRFEEALRRRTFAMVAGTTKMSSPRRQWFMALGAAVIVVAVIGAISIRPDRSSSQGQPGAVPSASASGSPSPSSPTDASLAFDRPFRFSVPAGVHLEVNDQDLPTLLQITDVSHSRPGSRGIKVVSLRSITTHPCPLVNGGPSRAPVGDRQPAFLDDLARVGGMTFALPMPTTVGSRPAVSTRLTATSCDSADFHLTNGAFIGLSMPSRLILVDFDGPSVAIQIWATTEDELAAWLPTAQSIIDSIVFVDPSPEISCGRIDAIDCHKSIDLVRSQTGADLSQVIRIVVDDVCPPEVSCDRRWPFDALVVLVGPADRSGDIGQVALHPYEVVGASGPETATPYAGELPPHINAALSGRD